MLSETVVTNVELFIEGGNVRLRQTKATFANHFDPSRLIVDRTLVETATEEQCLPVSEIVPVAPLRQNV